MPENKQVKKGTKVKVVPKPKAEIGIDTENSFQNIILDAANVSNLDVNKLESFTNVAQTRDQIYGTIDTMLNDSILSAVLETYTEDTVQTNDKGQVVWCEATDADVANYVQYLLDSLNVDKNMYEWAVKLIKYGDLYLKLFKESDYDIDPIFSTETTQPKENLNEGVKISVDSKYDHYVHYVEAVNNPAEIFELTKFGKTKGYIEAPITVQTPFGSTESTTMTFMRYNIRKKDVTVYPATDFVHAYLSDNSSRIPEEVNIFMDTAVEGEAGYGTSYNYKVRRGQSLFANTFKVWRELTLLENSVLLNRLTKSAIVRILNVETGDMPKEQVQAFIERLKSKIEQKSALNTNTSMSEYTNPAPIENVIYIPTHEGAGTITQNVMGGDVDPKQLTDLDWFNNKLFGTLRIPKQFFGFTEDGAGFNGGQSLTVISSRYGNAIKRIQNTLCQAVTDIVNLYLIDKGYDSYINQFTIRMQSPLTQEEISRREAADNKVRYIGDVMSQLGDISDSVPKLKILKVMLASVINDNEITEIIQEEIDKLEEQQKSKEETPNNETPEESNDLGFEEPLPTTSPIEFEGDELTTTEEPEQGNEEVGLENETEIGNEEPTEEPQGQEDRLPSPGELNIDMTQNF